MLNDQCPSRVLSGKQGVGCKGEVKGLMQVLFPLFFQQELPLVLFRHANAQTQKSSTKISNNSVVQALHLKEIYGAPSALGVVFQ